MRNNEKISNIKEALTRHIISIVLLAWVLMLVFYFLYQNRILFSVFRHIFDNYTITLNNVPYWDILLGYAVLAVYGLLGHLFISCFDTYFPRLIRMSLDLIVGIGIIGVLLEIPAIFFLLYQPIVVLILLLTLLVLIFLSRRHQRQPFPDAPATYDYYLSRKVRLQIARNRYEDTLLPRAGLMPGFTYSVALLLIAVISVLIFYHALLFPETYWDSLIYYIGYARKIFNHNGFPVKVTAQVGIGLGANYPHLYQLLTVSIAKVVGHWSEVFAQQVPPLAGLLSIIFIYHTILRLSRNRLLSIIVALLFTSVPYGIAYFTYASDYALAILFTAAVLYLALVYIDTRLYVYLVLTVLLCAFSTHINYLMWTLWVVWVTALIMAHIKLKPAVALVPTEEEELARKVVEEEIKTPGFTFEKEPLPFFKFVGQRKFILLVSLALLISSTWYIRNIVVTGNPVYPFFYKIFDGKHINPLVLENAMSEWLANGDGIAKFGPGLWRKLRYSWRFFVTWQHSWKLAPAFMAFVLPGVLVFIFRLVKRNLIGVRVPRIRERVKVLDDVLRFSIVALALFALLWFYHYCLAGFYLYHVIIVLPLMAILAYHTIDVIRPRFCRYLVMWLIIVLGIVPGVAMGLMGFKFHSLATVAGKRYSPFELVAFRHPGMDREIFYRLSYGDDVDMWNYVNRHLQGEKILTHENRHFVYDDSITFVHLDDWELQKTYQMTSEEAKLALIKSLGINYYLYIPMEGRARDFLPAGRAELSELVGISRWRKDPEIVKEIFRSGPNVLYQFFWAKAGGSLNNN